MEYLKKEIRRGVNEKIFILFKLSYVMESILSLLSGPVEGIRDPVDSV